MGIPLSDSVYQLDIWIPLILFLLALKYYRDKLNNKILHFWQGLGEGFKFVTIAYFVVCVFIFIFFSLNEVVFQEYKSQILSAHLLRKEDFVASYSAKSFEVATDEINRLSKLGYAIGKFIRSIILSMFGVSIISVILRKNVNKG